MKKVLIMALCFLLLIATDAVAQYKYRDIGGVAVSSDCDTAAYYPIGKLCQDTDDGKLYKGTGSGVTEIAAGGSGDVSKVGTPSNHQWGYWSGDGTLAGATITASKPVCSDASGDPAVCAGTEGVWQTAITFGTGTETALASAPDASGGLLSVGGLGSVTQAYSAILDGLAGVTPANNGIFGYNNSGTLGLYTNHSHDDSAAHYFNATDSTKLFQYDLQYMTTGKKITYQPTAADNYSYKVTITGNTDVTMPTSGTIATQGGALGTPSFTALNMPSSNADPGTTAGQIKHDSTDTGSNSGGTAKWYDGAQVRSLVDTGTNYTLITKTEYIPIRYAEDGTTGPAAAAEISTSTAIGRGFDKDTDEDVVFWWVTPNDYVGGIKYRVIYALGADATADDTAVFSLAGCAAANSATLACTPGTAVTLADELGTDDDQYQVMISDYSTAVTVTDIAAGSLNRLVFLRDVSEDDYTEGDLLVIGIEIKYQAKIIGNEGY